jgi:hypothetical protein
LEFKIKLEHSFSSGYNNNSFVKHQLH